MDQDQLSAEQIAKRAFDLDLLDDRGYREIGGEARRLDAGEFQQLLLRRELLTPYQMERLLRGDRSGFFYGQYKVLYQVGAGTFARVYRTVHRETGQVMAVKVLRQRFSNDPEKRSRFDKEADVGRSLRHPNIVAIQEVGSDKSSHYIIMEFVEGQTLRDFMRVRKQLQPLAALRLMTDVTRGLDFAFRRGVFHRDMKASNVLVSSSGQAKLVDFGLAGIDPTVSDDALAGVDNPRTIDYVALERASNVRKDDSRSDIYFIGAIFYHMLAGAPPLLETRDRLQRLSSGRFFDVVPLRQRCVELPGIVTAIVDKAMELDPRLRYQTPGEMLADITAVEHRLRENEDPDLATLPSSNAGGSQPIVMLVESSARVQERGADEAEEPWLSSACDWRSRIRPSEWFSAGMSPADCVLFSTGNLGELGVGIRSIALRRQYGHRASPAVLLLGARKHQDLLAEARLAPHRQIVTSPFRMQELLELMERIIRPVPTETQVEDRVESTSPAES